MGKQPGTIVQIQLVDIHGSRFYDLSFTLDKSPEKVQVSRIGTESVYAEPQAGDRAVFHLLLGQLTQVQKMEAESA